MTKQFNINIGQRDIEILTALDRCPLTPNQLCKLSQTFLRPFHSEHNLRRRLRSLEKWKLVQRFPYAIANNGQSPRYWKLTRNGYRLLYGETAALPKRRYFEAIKPGHHHHTLSLAESIVHICVAAHENGCEVVAFARENSVKLVAEPFTLYPDCSFVIRRGDGRIYSFIVELDNGTERIRSKQDVESIERKLRGYDAHQSKFSAHDPQRYLVLFITTRSEQRLQHILEVAANVMRQPQRRVFVGCDLQSLLSADPFHVPIFEDHRGLRRTIIPTQPIDKTDKLGREKTASFAAGNIQQVVF